MTDIARMRESDPLRCGNCSATAHSAASTSVLTRTCCVSGRQGSRKFATSSSTAGRVPDLAGRTALVTGTAHGIGAAIAEALDRCGATVHKVDRDTVDVADSEQVAELASQIGRVDILVNNAGGVVGQVGRPLEEVPDEDWRAVVDANLTSTFVCTRAFVPGMKAAGYGRIVNISSGAGRSVSLTGIQAYASAKAGQSASRARRHTNSGRSGSPSTASLRASCSPIPPVFASGRATARTGSAHCSSESQRGASEHRRTLRTVCCSSSPRRHPGSRAR
jgi:hypothetical protein